MNKKVCDKCGNSYDETLDKCPVCNNLSSEFNITNPFLNSTTDKQEETSDVLETVPPTVVVMDVINNEDLLKKEETKEKVELNKKESIIFEPKIENKIEKINNRNTSLKKKKKKKNNTFYCYLLLIISMILLFIIILSTLNEFVAIPFFHYILTVVILIVGFNLSYRDIDVGYFLGIVGALSMIFMIYERDYISAIVGVYIFASSFRYMIKK